MNPSFSGVIADSIVLGTNSILFGFKSNRSGLAAFGEFRRRFLLFSGNSGKLIRVCRGGWFGVSYLGWMLAKVDLTPSGVIERKKFIGRDIFGLGTKELEVARRSVG